MKIYCFSGLGADERVFQYLNIDERFELVNVPWVKPECGEDLKSYSKRLSQSIDDSDDFGLLGVSFGGVIAQEVGRIIKPKFTILISSVKDRGSVPLALRLIPDSLFKVLPDGIFKLPQAVANYLFGANNKNLLREILNDTDSSFVKWALMGLSNWRGYSSLDDLFLISGEKDRLFKSKNADVVILNGYHFMIVDNAIEVSEELNKQIKNI